jgi:hypothetical protein
MHYTQRQVVPIRNIRHSAFACPSEEYYGNLLGHDKTRSLTFIGQKSEIKRFVTRNSCTKEERIVG